MMMKFNILFYDPKIAGGLLHAASVCWVQHFYDIFDFLQAWEAFSILFELW